MRSTSSPSSLLLISSSLLLAVGSATLTMIGTLSRLAGGGWGGSDVVSEGGEGERVGRKEG